MQPPKENGGSVTVKMQPGAAVTGRLIDADAQPRAGVELDLHFSTKSVPAFSHIKTDRDGRFRIGALLPEYEYGLSRGPAEVFLVKGLRSGETKNLGDVRLRAAGE